MSNRDPMQALQTSEIHAMTDDQLRCLARATAKLAEETQRQASHYDRERGKLEQEWMRRGSNDLPGSAYRWYGLDAIHARSDSR